MSTKTRNYSQFVAVLVIGVILGAGVGIAYQSARTPPGVDPKDYNKLKSDFDAMKVSLADLTKPIKIGLICGITGRTATQGYRIKVGWELAQQDFPKALNRPIEFIIEDHQSTADACVEAYRKLIDVDKVSLLLVAAGSAFQLAAAPRAIEKRIPVISIVATSEKTRTLGEKGYYYSVIALDSAIGKATADYAFKDSGKIGKFGVIAMDDPYGRGVAGAFSNRAIQLGGTKISEVYYASGKSDFRAEITALFPEKLDTVFSVVWELDAKIIFKNAYELGFYEAHKGHWYTPYISDSVVTPDPITIEGLKGIDPSFATERGADFVKRVLAKDPKLVQPGYYPVKAYDAWQVAITAINLAGSDNPAQIDAKLSLAMNMVMGLAGPRAVDKNGQPLFETFSIVEYKNGKLVELGKLTVETPGPT